MSAPRRDAGFTLVEMLIAMFIFSLISVGAMSALTGTLRGKAQMDARLEVIQNIEGARALMKSDFAALTLQPVRDAYGTPEQYLLRGGDDTLITFTRTGRINPGGLEPRGDLQRLSYVFEGGQLIRRSLDHSNPAPLTEVRDRVLFDDVVRAEIGFLNGDVTNTQIFFRPGEPTPLPPVIRLSLEFNNGDALVQNFEVKP